MTRQLNRIRLLKKYHGLYKRLYKGTDSCFYCGIPADTDDHVPPLSWVDALGPSYFEPSGLWLVPACRECNTLLSSRKLFTFQARRKALLKRYQIRYKKVLFTSEWTLDEIDELGPNLQRIVRAFSDNQLVAFRRLERLHHAIVGRSLAGDAPNLEEMGDMVPEQRARQELSSYLPVG